MTSTTALRPHLTHSGKKNTPDGVHIHETRPNTTQPSRDCIASSNVYSKVLRIFRISGRISRGRERPLFPPKSRERFPNVGKFDAAKRTVSGGPRRRRARRAPADRSRCAFRSKRTRHFGLEASDKGHDRDGPNAPRGVQVYVCVPDHSTIRTFEPRTLSLLSKANVESSISSLELVRWLRATSSGAARSA